MLANLTYLIIFALFAPIFGEAWPLLLGLLAAIRYVLRPKGALKAQQRLGSPTSLPLMLSWLFITGLMGLALGLLFVPPAWGVALALPLTGGIGALLRARLLVRRWRAALAARELGAVRWRGLELWVELPTPRGMLLKPRRTWGVHELGDPTFDERFLLDEWTPEALAYLTPARRAALLQLRGLFARRWRPGGLYAPLRFFDGSAEAIEAACEALMPLRDRPEEPNPRARLAARLSAEEDTLEVAYHGLERIEPERRGPVIEALWARFPGWGDRLYLARLPHPERDARLGMILDSNAPFDAVRADALRAMRSPLEEVLPWLNSEVKIRAAALERLAAGGFCLTSAALEALIPLGERGADFAEGLLRMAGVGWGPALAARVRGLLEDPRAETRGRAVAVLAELDDDVAALSAALERAPRAERRSIKAAIERVRARHANAAGGLALSAGRGELSVAVDSGGLSEA